MWDLPGLGLELVYPALVGGFLTTAPPGKPRAHLFLTQVGKGVNHVCEHRDLSPQLALHPPPSWPLETTQRAGSSVNCIAIHHWETSSGPMSSAEEIYELVFPIKTTAYTSFIQQIFMEHLLYTSNTLLGALVSIWLVFGSCSQEVRGDSSPHKRMREKHQQWASSWVCLLRDWIGSYIARLSEKPIV